ILAQIADQNMDPVSSILMEEEEIVRGFSPIPLGYPARADEAKF
ncbi:unnamed protein product, partial [Allacma fusca]